MARTATNKLIIVSLSGYDCRNKCVFSFCGNTVSECSRCNVIWKTLAQLWTSRSKWSFTSYDETWQLGTRWDIYVKGRGHSKTINDQISTLGGIFSPVLNVWTYFNQTYHSSSLLRPRDTDDVFNIIHTDWLTDNLPWNLLHFAVNHW